LTLPENWGQIGAGRWRRGSFAELALISGNSIHALLIAAFAVHGGQPKGCRDRVRRCNGVDLRSGAACSVPDANTDTDAISISISISNSDSISDAFADGH
jgi:hypothetical protein